MSMILSYAILAMGVSVAVWLLTLAWRLLKADELESKKSAARTHSILAAIRGRACTREDWMPDARVKGGLIYNRKRNRLEISGRLSKDTLERIFH